MIIMIILISLAALGVVGIVLYLAVYRGYCDDGGFIAIAVLTVLVAGASAISGGVCIGVNRPESVASTAYALSEKVRLYQADRQVIESYRPISDGEKAGFTSDITLEVMSTEQYYRMVRAYNEKVFDFKCEVKGKQYDRGNPWISWFVSEGYMSVSDEELDGLGYTLGR